MLLSLVHSPLMGSLTWTRLAAVLGARGVPVALPELRDDSASRLPLWRQQAESAAEDLNCQAAGQALVLVAHSGAGALLPAIRQSLPRPVAGYILVDAGWPVDGQTRLETFGAEAANFRAFLASGGQFPNWSQSDLEGIVPDAELAARLHGDQRPRSLPFWEEPIPVFAGWPDAPGGYLLFTETYRASAERARGAGWPARELAGGHFHMLVEPEAVADALLELAAPMG